MGLNAMKSRKYPRMKRCACCGKVRFLRHFQRIGRGRTLADWAKCCRSCEFNSLINKENHHDWMVFEFNVFAGCFGVVEIAFACVVYFDGLRIGGFFAEAVFRQPESAKIAQQYSAQTRQAACWKTDRIIFFCLLVLLTIWFYGILKMKQSQFNHHLSVEQPCVKQQLLHQHQTRLAAKYGVLGIRPTEAQKNRLLLHTRPFLNNSLHSRIVKAS